MEKLTNRKRQLKSKPFFRNTNLIKYPKCAKNKKPTFRKSPPMLFNLLK